MKISWSKAIFSHQIKFAEEIFLLELSQHLHIQHSGSCLYTITMSFILPLRTLTRVKVYTDYTLCIEKTKWDTEMYKRFASISVYKNTAFKLSCTCISRRKKSCFANIQNNTSPKFQAILPTNFSNQTADCHVHMDAFSSKFAYLKKKLDTHPKYSYYSCEILITISQRALLVDIFSMLTFSRSQLFNYSRAV